MGKVSINESTLTAIGAAIRNKTGKTDLIAPGDMPAEIRAIEGGGSTGGLEIPESALNLTGSISYYDSAGNWDWFIEAYGDQITTSKLGYCINAFESSALKTIPFEFNFHEDPVNNFISSFRVNNMFAGMYNITEFPKINMPSKTVPVEGLNSMFKNSYLKEIDLSWFPFEVNQTKTYSLDGIFYGMRCLRSIPEEYLKKLYKKLSSKYDYSSSIFRDGFNTCCVLDEIRGLYPQDTDGYVLSSNMFSNTFNNCHRIKEVIFATQEDGTPYVRDGWTNQTIDLVGGTYSPTVGYDSNDSLTDYGMSADKKVIDDATYQALKDDPDWWTNVRTYSRYNHDSAVNTINSLPDVSGSGGTNTIKFDTVMGGSTDGGAIGNLTEAEIAVAAAKGWTVSLK